MIIEHKALSAVIEADEALGIITGIASAPAVDREGDSFAPDAFDFELPVPMLFGHDQREVIGKWTDVEVTPTGLMVEGRLNLETARGREVYALLKSGDLRGLSVGFIPKAASETRTGRRITSADLLEISIVAVPANPAARILSVKGANTLSENDTHEARIEALELAAARPAVAQPAATGEDDGIVRKAFFSYIRHGEQRMQPDEVKSLTSGTSAGHTGGYLADHQFEAELVKNLVEHSPIRQIARVSSASAAEIILPVRTAGTTATWTAEWDTVSNPAGPQARTPSDPTYSQKKLTVFELATYTEISNALLEDSVFKLESELAQDFAEAFGKAEGTAFVKGTGSGQPGGFLTDATLTSGALTTAGSGAIAADDIISLTYSIPSAYRAKGTFVANRSTIAAIRKLKDTTGQYLWQPGLQAGEPERLLGYPLAEAPDVDDVAAGKFPLAFGDWTQGFRVFDRLSLSVLRDPYSAATNGLTRFHARRRVAAGVVKAEALKLLKVKA